jgi:hypothetical protein
MGIEMVGIELGIFIFGGGLVLAGILVSELLPSRKNAEIVGECEERFGQVLLHCV